MILLLFFYIFDFALIKSIPYISTSYLVFMFLLVVGFFNQQYGRMMNRYLLGKYNVIISTLYLILILFSLSIIFIKRTYDYTYAFSLVHQYICLEIGTMLVAYFKYKEKSIIPSIIDSFFVQSLIQISCFISSDLLSLTDIFRSDDTIIRRSMSYVGYRGLAISGTNFFGLAVVYAILFVVIAFYWKKWPKSLVLKIVYVCCLSFGAFSAGRTAFIGIMFFLILLPVFTFSLQVTKKKIIQGFSLFLFLSISITSYLIIFKDKVQSNDSMKRFMKYMFQFMDGTNSKRTKSLTQKIPSLDNLFNHMYFKLNKDQLLLGDGKFTENGYYYMHTDAGIMRNLLFWGIIGSIMLYSFFFAFVLLKTKKKTNSRYLGILIIVLCVIFEVKGQTMGFLIISQSLILLIVYAYREIDADNDVKLFSFKDIC